MKSRINLEVELIYVIRYWLHFIVFLSRKHESSVDHSSKNLYIVREKL